MTETPQENKSANLTIENTTVYPITRSGVGDTLAEDPSFINVRELNDWCRECREYKPSVVSATNLFAISLGAFAGFLPAWQATDVHQHGGWWGFFLFGTIAAVVGCGVALLAMVVQLPTVREKLHLKATRSMHDRLADTMEHACKAGLLRASAAEEALQREEEKARGQNAAAT
jgi:hypothetical protein